MKNFIFVTLIFLIGCASAQYKINEYEQTMKEADDMVKYAKNLTAEQKVILKHASIDLKSAQSLAKQNDQLNKDIISTSKDAGAGRLVYAIIGVSGFFALAYIVGKISKFSPF